MAHGSGARLENKMKCSWFYAPSEKETKAQCSCSKIATLENSLFSEPEDIWNTLTRTQSQINMADLLLYYLRISSIILWVVSFSLVSHNALPSVQLPLRFSE